MCGRFSLGTSAATLMNHFNVQDRLLPLLAPYPPEEMIAYPVSSLVNNPADDSPACQSSARDRS
jgi:putative SOS response-associated peptidase YedK